MTARILELILFTLCTASLSMFLIKCMEKGMIFRKYYNWITYWFLLKRKEYRIIKEIINTPKFEKIRCQTGELTNVVTGYIESELSYNKIILINNKYQWLWKILGGCQYCFGTWIFIVFYLYSIYPYSNFSLTLYGLVLGIGLNYLWIEVINKARDGKR